MAASESPGDARSRLGFEIGDTELLARDKVVCDRLIDVLAAGRGRAEPRSDLNPYERRRRTRGAGQVREVGGLSQYDSTHLRSRASFRVRLYDHVGETFSTISHDSRRHTRCHMYA